MGATSRLKVSACCWLNEWLLQVEARNKPTTAGRARAKAVRGFRAWEFAAILFGCQSFIQQLSARTRRHSSMRRDVAYYSLAVPRTHSAMALAQIRSELSEDTSVK